MDHFPQFPAHVGTPEPPGSPIKGHLPWIAKAKCPDFWPRTWRCEEGIVLWNAVGQPAVGSVYVNAQDAAQEIVQVLPRIQRVRRSRHFGVSSADVEVAVIPKLERGTVVPAASPVEEFYFCSGVYARRAILWNGKPG